MADASMNISRVVRTLLANQGKQQADLAAYMNVTAGVISKKLSGRSTITADDISDFAEYFNVGAGLFFDDPTTLVRNRWFLSPELV